MNVPQTERRKTMKSYGVELASGAHITTVYAESVEAARAQAFHSLNRPGRRSILGIWNGDRCPIRDKETDELFTE